MSSVVSLIATYLPAVSCLLSNYEAATVPCVLSILIEGMRFSWHGFGRCFLWCGREGGDETRLKMFPSMVFRGSKYLGAVFALARIGLLARTQNIR